MIDLIKEIIGTVNKGLTGENKLVRRNSFWCPKVFSDSKTQEHYEGFVLYICGGHALDVYDNKKNGIRIKPFDKTYIKHFKKDENDDEGEKRGQVIRNNLNATVKCTEPLPENIASVLNNCETWEAVYTAFEKWATKIKNPEYERMRQTRICADNERRNDFCVFTMEEKFGNAEVDMIAIRTKEDKRTLVFIEYKCTNSAVEGNTSFAKHYDDYVTILNDPKNKQRAIELFNRKQMLLGKKKIELKPEEVDVEIAFLLSNIVVGKIDKKFEDTNKQVSMVEVKKELSKVSDKNIKVLVMNHYDVNVNIGGRYYRLSEAAETTIKQIGSITF